MMPNGAPRTGPLTPARPMDTPGPRCFSTRAILGGHLYSLLCPRGLPVVPLACPTDSPPHPEASQQFPPIPQVRNPQNCRPLP